MNTIETFPTNISIRDYGDTYRIVVTDVTGQDYVSACNHKCVAHAMNQMAEIGALLNTSKLEDVSKRMFVPAVGFYCEVTEPQDIPDWFEHKDEDKDEDNLPF